MKRLAALCRLWIAIAVLCSGAAPQAAQTVRIGVLSFQSKLDTSRQWTPTARSLSQSIPGFSFEITPLNYDELNLAVKEKRVDFVLTNPEHYVVLRNVFFLRPMVTINAQVEGQVFNQFGSAIFTRYDLSEIQRLADVRGKKVAAVGLYSMGGFLMAADMFRHEHIDLRSSDVSALKFVGLPHSRVVEDVINGHSDVGIVRTGVLEQMVRQGTLRMAQIRILNAQPDGAFPQALSTEMYPEWPWAAVPGTPDTLVKAVTLSLLNLRPESEEARVGKFHSFSPPANYAPVETLMRRLKVYPGVEETPLWENLWEIYSTRIQLGALVLLILVLTLAIYLWRKNRRLRRLTGLYREAQTGLQITSSAFASQVALIVTDVQTRIVRANDAFCQTMGFTEAELIGKTTAVLRGDGVPRGTGNKIWPQLLADGQWRGELSIRHKDGHELPCRVTISEVKDDLSKRTGFVCTYLDLSEQKRTESEIRALAYFDTLTGLPNRRMFLEQLQTAMSASVKNEQLGAVLFIDLDNFKILNDSHGHTVGDELLQQIANRLQFTFVDHALAARLGGDEFVVMLHGLNSDPVIATRSAMTIAESLRETILAPYQLHINPGLGGDTGLLRYSCSGSIGVALFGLHEEPLVEVLKRADVAMYQAKQSGRNAIRPYDPTGQEWLKEKLALSNDLNSALPDGQLVLHFQLQIFAEGRVAGAECLLRWKHPQRGMVPPIEFIGLAEESGAIVPIGEWVLQTACNTLARWALNEATEAFTLSVNVSPRQFIEASFSPKLEAMLLQSGARPERLILEITEGIALGNTDRVIKKMLGLRNLGIQFSIDDFGTGYSSLSYLHALPLHEVKIDRAFVSDLTENSGSEAVVRAIIALGSSLQLQVVSEGVETQAQQDQLVAMGCTLLQGYWVAKPMELAAFERLIEARQGS